MKHKPVSKVRGYIAALVIVLLPVILWQLSPTKMSGPFGLAFVLATLGKTFALAGTAAYFMNPILSMRHQIFERLFGGMDTLYKIHKKSGKITFFLLWSHPILLASAALVNGASISNVWSWSSVLIIAGIVSLIGVTTITAITIYAHIKHQKWIVVHRLFGWIMPIIFFHALVAKSQIVKNKPLLFYMTTLFVISMFCFLYRSVFTYFIKRYKYMISEVNSVGPGVLELVLKPIGVPITYTPGQYAYMAVHNKMVDPEPHPFSFTTAANGPYVRFVIKELGDDTKKMKNLKRGDKVFLEGPYGGFSYHNTKNKKQIWIAGGVGVTPFLSMARSLSPKSKYSVHLIYASEKLDEVVFLKELLMIRKSVPKVFNLTVVNRDISGFVTIEMINKMIPTMDKHDFLLCGPPPMINKLKSDLHKKQIDSSQIYSEEFSLL